MRGLDAADGGGGFEGDIFEGFDVDVFFGGVGFFLFGLLLAAFAFLLILDAVDAGVGEVFDVLGVLKIFGGLDLAGADGFVAFTLNRRERGGDGGLGDHCHSETLVDRLVQSVPRTHFDSGISTIRCVSLEILRVDS
jgi:hypothetical protein